MIGNGRVPLIGGQIEIPVDPRLLDDDLKIAFAKSGGQQQIIPMLLLLQCVRDLNILKAEIHARDGSGKADNADNSSGSTETEA